MCKIELIFCFSQRNDTSQLSFLLKIDFLTHIFKIEIKHSYAHLQHLIYLKLINDGPIINEESFYVIYVQGNSMKLNDRNCKYELILID